MYLISHFPEGIFLNQFPHWYFIVKYFRAIKLNECVLFFSVPYEELRQRYLQFSVYDFDRFSRHDLIGHVVLKGLLDTTDLQQEIEYTMNILCPPQVSSIKNSPI